MAKINLILDPRVRKDGTSMVMLSFIHRRYRRQLSLGLSVPVKYWQSETGTVSIDYPKSRLINSRLAHFKSSAEVVLYRHLGSNDDGAAIFAEIEAALFPKRAMGQSGEENCKSSLLETAKNFSALKKPSTRLTYERTVKHIETFIDKGGSNILDEVNNAWLASFDSYLAESNPSPNARALHFRNLRAIFNYAIDEELTANYPFRRFKIKTVKTEKRNLSVETLRQIFNYPIENWQVAYRDMFKLSFMLMGINFADMLNLKPEDMRDGRIVFNRHKTARLYSMKVEPEALELIREYAGSAHLLSIMDSRKDYLQYIRQTNHALKCIGTKSAKGRKPQGNPLARGITTYWARHTWATIAASLDIPKETIAAALGHGGNSVTDIYIDFDRRKVDDANRRVLDYVLYGKRQSFTG